MFATVAAQCRNIVGWGLPLEATASAAEGAIAVSAALVSAGTSRALILSGEDLDDATADAMVRALVEGWRGGGGLFGGHYQSNKVAVMWNAPFSAGFVFRFYQYDSANDRLLSGLECSNVTAGCAAYALASGVVLPGADGVIYALNSGTGQESLLLPSLSGNPWRREWSVRFLQRGFGTYTTPMEPLAVSGPEGDSVECWPFERGNVFVFAHTAPRAAPSSLVGALAERGGRVAAERGADAGKAAVPKVVLYEVAGAHLGEAWLDVACHFLGERHRSLPGSGAMVLAGFLTLSRLAAVRPSESGGAWVFHMRHPSGALSVTTRWSFDGTDYRVDATEFVTPVSIIIAGSVLIEVGVDGVHNAD